MSSYARIQKHFSHLVAVCGKDGRLMQYIFYARGSSFFCNDRVANSGKISWSLFSGEVGHTWNTLLLTIYNGNSDPEARRDFTALKRDTSEWRTQIMWLLVEAPRQASLTMEIFSSAAISKEHAVFWFDKHARRFYLRNQESSTGCLLNEENVGKCAAVELINGDRVVFGHSEGAVRAIVMLEVVEDEVEDDDIQSQSLHAVHKEAEWRAMMQMEDKLYKENKEKEKKKQKEKEKEAVLDLNTEYWGKNYKSDKIWQVFFIFELLAPTGYNALVQHQRFKF